MFLDWEFFGPVIFISIFALFAMASSKRDKQTSNRAHDKVIDLRSRGIDARICEKCGGKGRTAWGNNCKRCGGEGYTYKMPPVARKPRKALDADPPVINYTCPSCGTDLRSKRSQIGQTMICPKCSTTVKVPDW
jgi:DNA-directed RNA polymerase subunit M/transcription elongation factor TFIIS